MIHETMDLCHYRVAPIREINMYVLRSTSAVLAARKAENEGRVALVVAYSATRDDMATVKPADIGKAWKAVGITPASEQVVRDYAMAAELTDLGDALWRAIEAVERGGFRKPHAYVMQAREAVKSAGVRALVAALIASLNGPVDDVEPDLDERVRLISRWLRALPKKTRAARPNDGTGEGTDTGTGEGEGVLVEGEGETVAPTGSDPSGALARVTSDLGKIVQRWERDGDAPGADAVAAFGAMAMMLNNLDRRRVVASRDVG